MFNSYPITAALEVAANNPEGFTISHDMTEQPTSGYAVAIPETQGSHGICGFLRTLAYAIENGTYFGGWLDTKTMEYYWDAVRVFPEGKLQDASEYGRSTGQIAIFDLGNGVEIRL
jgi:hypothetical protein